MPHVLPYVLAFGAVIGAVLTFRWWTWFLRFQFRVSKPLIAQTISAMLVFGGSILAGVLGQAILIALVLTMMAALHSATLLTMWLTIRQLRRCVEAGFRSEDADWQRIAQEAKPHLLQAEVLRMDDAWSDAQKEATRGLRLFYDHAGRLGG